MLNHRVDGFGEAQELAFQGSPLHIKRHSLREVTVGDGANDACHLACRSHQILYERIERINQIHPRAGGRRECGALRDFAVAPDHAAHALEFLGCLLIQLDDVIKRVCYFSSLARPVSR